MDITLTVAELEAKVLKGELISPDMLAAARQREEAAARIKALQEQKAAEDAIKATDIQRQKEFHDLKGEFADFIAAEELNSDAYHRLLIVARELPLKMKKAVKAHNRRYHEITAICRDPYKSGPRRSSEY